MPDPVEPVLPPDLKFSPGELATEAMHALNWMIRVASCPPGTFIPSEQLPAFAEYKPKGAPKGRSASSRRNPPKKDKGV